MKSTEQLRLLRPDTMQPTPTKLAFPGSKPVTGADVQFSADGRYLAATVSTGHAVVWDLRSPSTTPVRVLTGTGSPGALGYQPLALGPDGQTLYTAWPLTAFEVATGKRIWRREEVKSAWPLDVNAEGTLLALGDNQSLQDALLVDAATGDTVATLQGHRDVVTDIRFSPDGTLVGLRFKRRRAHRLGHLQRPATGTVGHLRSVGRRLQPGQ